MKTTLVLGALAAALLTAAPAWADHNRLVAPADAEREATAEGARPEGSTTDSTLDIDLKLGLKGFRFGTRLFGVEIDEWLRHAARWWSRGLTDL